MILRKHALLLATFVALLAACTSTPRQPFLQAYRVDYSLVDEELEALQFFLSGDVLVRFEDGNGPQSMLLTEGTPGICTAVGPDWLRISFREGGYDVPFVSPSEHDRYWLATNDEGEGAFQRLSNKDEKAFVLDGVTYSVVYGEDVHLVIDRVSLQALIDKRIVTKEGRTVDG